MRWHWSRVNWCYSSDGIAHVIIQWGCFKMKYMFGSIFTHPGPYSILNDVSPFKLGTPYCEGCTLPHNAVILLFKKKRISVFKKWHLSISQLQCTTWCGFRWSHDQPLGFWWAFWLPGLDPAVLFLVCTNHLLFKMSTKEKKHSVLMPNNV